MLRRQPRLMRQIGEQSIAPSRLVNFRANMAVEVAIRAFGDAEWPVDINGERAAFHVRNWRPPIWQMLLPGG